ncbi:MAG TPA: NrfD/PsrC family molybdoenzyme membrane anchor subunit [Bryobacteraceae bacterium]|jgi:formate-dependent nitrite reductase membrane component NrfD|nr:NrfD/PsrC family molybdoenzyme membrane anchor subunit [Bryobacteraceae bacterium]
MSKDDSRNIDQTLGTLSGEAAAQTPLASKHDVALHSQAYPYIPSHQSTTSPTYYDHPMLKQPVWIWSIPAYFYVGGVAGLSAALGAAAQLFAPVAMRSLILRARWVATVGGAGSAALLIHDLGRPERFLNMLRVFRVSSPMSMGSWILSGFSTCVGGAAVLPLGPRLFRPLAYPLGLLGGVLGLGLSGYTGVLLSQTAVPVWHQSYRTMPVMFLASGTAAAAAFFDFFRLNNAETKAVEIFGLMGKIIELLAAQSLETEASRVSRVGRPLKSGFSGFLWQTAKLLTVAGIILAVTPGKRHGKRIASGLIGSAASLCLRFGIFHAGKASARDPRSSFESQRQLAAR